MAPTNKLSKLNVKKVDKLIKKLDPKDIKSTVSLVMFICDIIEKTHSNNENKDKVLLFLQSADIIAEKLVAKKLISKELAKDLDKYTDIAEDFYEMWGKTRKYCSWACKATPRVEAA